MITLFFIAIAAMLAARADVNKKSLRNTEVGGAYVASLCIAIVSYPIAPMISPTIDFIIFFFEYFAAYDVGFLITKNAFRKIPTF
jgi:hypothetical protein